MKATTKIVNAVASDDIAAANEAFASAIKEKVNTALDIKKIELTSRVFDKATGK
jgi:hypothetical protein